MGAADVGPSVPADEASGMPAAERTTYGKITAGAARVERPFRFLGLVLEVAVREEMATLNLQWSPGYDHVLRQHLGAKPAALAGRGSRMGCWGCVLVSQKRARLTAPPRAG